MKGEKEKGLKKIGKKEKGVFFTQGYFGETGNTLLTLMTWTYIYAFTGQFLVFQKEEGRFIKEGESMKWIFHRKN